MEKEGLIRSVRLIEDAGLEIGSLVTDRHPQIQKHVREQMKSTTHYFDVWHVAKGKLVLKGVFDICMKFTLTQWQYLRWLIWL